MIRCLTCGDVLVNKIHECRFSRATDTVVPCHECESLRARVAALTEALKTYGRHGYRCDVDKYINEPCTCGLDAAVKGVNCDHQWVGTSTASLPPKVIETHCGICGLKKDLP